MTGGCDFNHPRLPNLQLRDMEPDDLNKLLDGTQSHWVFSHFIKNIPVLERNCGTENAAASRVKELRERGQDAFWCNTLPLLYWY